jgi:ubiquitin-small subunit ribosomal protein S27Ae
MAGKKAVEGKKEHKNKPTSKRYAKYKIEGDKITRTLKFCPRCGPGIFLMESDGRVYCGKCHYAEFGGKKAPAPSEGVPSEEGKEEPSKENKETPVKKE